MAFVLKIKIEDFKRCGLVYSNCNYLPTPSSLVYYAISKTGSNREIMGDLKTNFQLLTESQSRIDTRTYVRDQIGKQILTAGSGVDFGTRSVALRNQEYIKFNSNN